MDLVGGRHKFILTPLGYESYLCGISYIMDGYLSISEIEFSFHVSMSRNPMDVYTSV